MNATAIEKAMLWTVDQAHSEIGFRVKHLMITNVKGVFRTFDIKVGTRSENFEDARIDFSMDPASIFTGDEKRDAHLKSADFFDAEKFGKITFRSKSFTRISDDGNFELRGDLTMKNITHPVKLAVEFNGINKDPWGNQKAGFTVTGKINRKDWGLNWNVALESGGVLVGEEVTLLADVQLVRINND